MLRFSIGWGYTVAAALGKSPASDLFSEKKTMSRPILLLGLLLLLIVGGAVLLAGRAREVPTQPIEIDVTREAGTR